MATYNISTTAHMQELHHHGSDDCVLLNDIDMAGITYNNDFIFTGTFNGAGFTISNLTTITDYGGLFKDIRGSANIHDLILKDADITAVWFAGILAAKVTASIGNTITITKIVVTGKLTTSRDIGGLIGRVTNSDAGGTVNVSECYAVTEITQPATIDPASGWVGGLIGSAIDYNSATPSATLNATNCFSAGIAYVRGPAGGFMSGKDIQYNVNLDKCYSVGLVIGVEWSASQGGFTGTIQDPAVTYGYWNLDTSYQSSSGTGVGKTDTQMKTEGTFETWNFTTIWGIDADINNGYPYLLFHEPESWRQLYVITDDISNEEATYVEFNGESFCAGTVDVYFEWETDATGSGSTTAETLTEYAYVTHSISLSETWSTGSFRMVATDGVDTFYGEWVDFVCPDSPPDASTVTVAATNISISYAQLNGTQSGNDSVYFIYGRSATSMNLTTPLQSASSPFNYRVAGLSPGVTHYFQAVGVGGIGGTNYGSVLSFKTLDQVIDTTPRAGYQWIEGTDYHYIDASGVERKATGVLV